MIAMLEDPDDRDRQEALEAGASYVWSKPDLLVAQMRYELGARLGIYVPERPPTHGVRCLLSGGLLKHHAAPTSRAAALALAIIPEPQAHCSRLAAN